MSIEQLKPLRMLSVNLILWTFKVDLTIFLEFYGAIHKFSS